MLVGALVVAPWLGSPLMDDLGKDAFRTTEGAIWSRRTRQTGRATALRPARWTTAPTSSRTPPVRSRANRHPPERRPRPRLRRPAIPRHPRRSGRSTRGGRRRWTAGIPDDDDRCQWFSRRAGDRRHGAGGRGAVRDGETARHKAHRHPAHTHAGGPRHVERKSARPGQAHRPSQIPRLHSRDRAQDRRRLSEGLGGLAAGILDPCRSQGHDVRRLRRSPTRPSRARCSTSRARSLPC